MGLRIYGIAKSRTFRVLWAATELTIPYEHVEIGFADGSNKTPEYLAINPLGRVPAIEDDGLRLVESMAITLYLARKYGQKTIWPDTIEGEGQAFQWSFFGVTELEAHVNAWGYHTMVLAPEARDPAKAAAALEALKKPLAVLDQHLATRAFLLGEKFTVADLNLASVLYRALSMDLGAVPNVKRWLDRCYARDAARAARALREA
ncbi:MAG: glutathione S-transferase family protein [Alphaproteobacteria bacterium]|nr:glutathione S-transferase family protein [Alphaproteobacteria bacterium]